MKGTSRTKRTSSLICLVLGIIITIVAITVDILATVGFISSDQWYRGPLLILGIIGIVLGLYFYPTIKHHRNIINFLFLFPLLFAFFVTVILPLFLGLFYSFTDWDGIQFHNIIGFGNYTRMFKDPQLVWSILITFLFVVFDMILVNLVAFLLALLCTSKLPGMGFFRASFFLPNLIGGIVLGYIWQFIFANVVTIITTKYFDRAYSLLSDTNTALAAIVVVYIWQYAGYIMLIYITGLNTIPGDVLEAAAIDGASPLQTLFNIKIPMIAPTITICTFLTLTSSFKQFDVNLALTNGAGFVSNFMGEILSEGTQMLALNIYETAIKSNEYAFAQAKAFLFFVILACVSIIQVRISNKKEVEL
ncbi:carbohydrate ABC transporter permease [Butyrivibrio proteoclasticus]|uniref:carbohydrate ABC transporter permease n=1 Tax=Butyrivibrio proteoclasticus TaxID=43305 RepID=UPI00047C6CE2|nr:sugar ABC transporter permease [Butyrivibrio proteoclasticus]